MIFVPLPHSGRSPDEPDSTVHVDRGFVSHGLLASGSIRGKDQPIDNSPTVTHGFPAVDSRKLAKVRNDSRTSSNDPPPSIKAHSSVLH